MFPLLGICSGCEEVIKRLDDLDIYQRCSWYRYPPEIQRAMIMVILGSQDLNPFKMCGSLTASRETCKKVSRLKMNDRFGIHSTLLTYVSFQRWSKWLSLDSWCSDHFCNSRFKVKITLGWDTTNTSTSYRLKLIFKFQKTSN